MFQFQPFVKLYGSRLLSSTLWEECWQARFTFIVLLVLADERGRVDIPTLATIARFANLPIEEVEKGMEVLMRPDPTSRNQEHEGRRVIALAPGQGFQVVSYRDYRDLRTPSQVAQAKRVADYRARKREADVTCNAGNGKNEIENEKERDIEGEHDGRPEPSELHLTHTPPTAATPTPRRKRQMAAPDPDAQRVLDHLNARRSRLDPRVRRLTPTVSNLAQIKRALEDGESVESLCEAVDVAAQAASRDPDQFQWLNPVTIFRAGNLPRYLAQAKSPTSTPAASQRPKTPSELLAEIKAREGGSNGQDRHTSDAGGHRRAP